MRDDVSDQVYFWNGVEVHNVTPGIYNTGELRIPELSTMCQQVWLLNQRIVSAQNRTFTVIDSGTM